MYERRLFKYFCIFCKPQVMPDAKNYYLIYINVIIVSINAIQIAMFIKH